MSIYKQKGSEIWWVSIGHAGKRVRRSTGETDRTKAQRRHDEIKAELWQIAPDTKDATWGSAVMAWTDVEPRSESELLSLKKFTSIHGDCRLDQVTRESVHKALSFCKTAGTYTRYRTMIAAILNLAYRAGHLAKPPLLATRSDKKIKPRLWLTHKQWSILYDELPRHMKPMAKFAVETGLRQANVLGLRWSHVSLERQMLWVEAEDAKEGKAIGIPLNSEAMKVLREQWDDPKHHNEFIFTYAGHPVKEIKTAFSAACRRAKIPPGFSWHGLRHTWATWHMQNGTPDAVLQKLGAWSDPRMVQTYAHHSPTYLAKFAANNRPKTKRPK